MTIEVALDIAQTLVGERVDPVGRSLELAARIAAHGRADDIFRRVIRDEKRLATILDLVSSLDHVGFLVPTDDKARVSAAAAKAGFDVLNSVFPSAILARELGEISGCHMVPTSILKARGTTSSNAPIIVEVFMPHAVDPALVREWIKTGVGPHIAFCVRTLGDLSAVTPILEAEGFRLPQFMRERPLTNHIEKVTTLYFDVRFEGHFLRLEFCHYG